MRVLLRPHDDVEGKRRALEIERDDDDDGVCVCVCSFLSRGVRVAKGGARDGV